MLDRFSPAVSAWFSSSFPEPTPAQSQGWPAIADGGHTLICAPTGSGKTLAAFLWSIDRIVTAPLPEKTRRTRVLYISPLRALAFDVEKNLRAPIAGIGLAAERLGVADGFVAPVVGMRTGDSSSRDRAALIRHPPDILITTPESLYLMLTSSARETLRGVDVVIIDEIHAMATTKRGAHLMLSLERLDVLCERPPQRVALSATQRPLEEVARFLGGFAASGTPRPVSIVDAGIRKPLEVEVVVPVEDMGDLGSVTDEPASGPVAAGPARKSIWPSVHPKILELVLAHRSTIIFCNARRLAERLAARLNELAAGQGVEGPDGGDLVKAHHGSLAREQRVQIEDQLKSGKLRALVATSSLELGIDMGAVDLVVQVESPGAVSRGIQRIGRAGHQVGEPSKGKVFPKHRGDLLEAAVVVQRMRQGLIESTRYLRNPLDVLAQQIVAMTAVEEWAVDDLAALVRRCACFSELTDDVFTSVLDLLAGRYPSDEFNELRPRVVWDRVAGRVRARDGSKRLAVTSGGTIPDRGLFGVFLPDGKRVGELDEEMVYESRPGETFLLGASTWRIEDITFERVIVTPAPGQPGKMPFWHGDRPGRPLELGRALGAFVREIRGLDHDTAVARLRSVEGLDAWAADNLVRYLEEQAEACGAVPDDRTIVVERFRDEIGDWRVCVLTPFGTPVHAPWAMAIEARLMERHGVPVETMWSDDGIVIRLPEALDELPATDIAIDPDDIEELVMSTLPSTSLFAARFRECAARALLLPRRRPDKRTPLWQQRQRAADLLAVAARYPSFPILLEASRECLQDVFDVPALRSVLTELRSRRIRVVSVDTAKASPFSQSLLFNWIAAYMYEGDAPLAERRAAALSLDRDLLRELLGAEELRELLDRDVLVSVELELQRLVDGRRARTADELHDVLRVVGDLTIDELDGRCEGGQAAEFVDGLVAERRAIAVRVAGQDRVSAAEDAARLRDGLGVSLPLGLPVAFTDPVARPLEGLVARYAATHTPFLARDVSLRLGVPVERVEAALLLLSDEGRVVRGEFRPEGTTREWCDVDVLRVLRRRSLATLRREVEPVEPVALTRFLAHWHGIGGARRGLDALVDTLGVLQGAALPASILETDLLPARVNGYRAADVDALIAAGDLVWVGGGALGPSDGRVRLFFRDQVALLLDDSAVADAPTGPVHDALRAHLRERGASFWLPLANAAAGAAGSASPQEALAALWDLVWAGEVTNDTLAPLRSFVGAKTAKALAPSARGRPRPGRLTRLGPPAGAGRWSLVSELVERRPSPTERAHARALQMLERHGVLTREAALAEGIEGGFAGVYPVLKALEERGQVRRGYFVAGLGAAQFALPGAVDRLRSCREPDADSAAIVVAATDPAQPYGAALAWPQSSSRPARTAGALVVLAGGEALCYLERGGRQLVLFPAAAGDDRWIDALAVLVKDGRRRSIELRMIDGEAAISSPHAAGLRAVGFRDGYRGLVLRS
ncbi:MAG: DEAD/DEAH box helicase [Acidimicrobiales bacterium]